MSLSKYIGRVKYILIGFLLYGSAMAQPATFIHIQSENNKAFTVQWKENTYPSSSTGYLVIPQVTAGEHTFIFGFQDTSLPAYRFTLTMDDKPRGFSLRQSISNTWSLFDMVSFAINKGTENPKQMEEKPVMVVTKPVEPEKKPLPSADTVAKAGASPSLALITEKPVLNKASLFNEPPVQKIFDKANAAGIDQVYIIMHKGKADTIAVFIPALKEEIPKQAAFKIKKGYSDVYIAYNFSSPAYTDRLKLSIK